MQTFFLALLIISSLTIIVSVTLQEPKTSGMGTIAGEDTNIFGIGSKANDREVILNRVIIISFVVFLLSSILLQVK